ncbi:MULTISPECIES: hypothetical protein [unclassified Nocardioides]|uniref:hypothetical protein n=1 Tax=unclassified Nocardioides TaxID=2615069 RepID=UPI0030141F92
MSRRTLPARRLAAAAVLPLALTTLAACSDGDPGPGVVSDSAGVSTPDLPDESADAPEVPELGEPADDVVDGAAEGDEIEPAEFVKLFEDAFAGGTSRMSMAMSLATGEMSAEGVADYSTNPAEMALTMKGAGMPAAGVEMRIVDGAMFMKIPGMGADDKFFTIDLSDPDNPLGQSLTGQLDPKAMFESFGEALESVVYEGEEDVDGDAADAYAVTVDAAKVLESQGLPSGAPGTESMAPTITYRMLFATDDGSFRRMSVDLGESLGSVTMDFSDWGQDVDIEAPPADQVTEFPGAGGLAAG